MLKSIEEAEKETLTALCDILKQSKYIIPYGILDENPKFYMVMPLLPVTLDKFPRK